MLHIQNNQDSKIQFNNFDFWNKFFFKKSILSVEIRKKMIITIEFFIFKLVQALIFSLNWQFQLFGPHLPTKGSYFQCKTDKIDTTIEFCIFELAFVSNFTLNKQFWIFGPNLPKRKIFMFKNRKNWAPSLNSSNSN